MTAQYKRKSSWLRLTVYLMFVPVSGVALAACSPEGTESTVGTDSNNEPGDACAEYSNGPVVPDLLISNERVPPTIIQWQDENYDRPEPDIIHWHPVSVASRLSFRLASAQRQEVRGVIVRLFDSIDTNNQKPSQASPPITLASGIGDSYDFPLSQCKDGAAIAIPRGVKFAAINVFHNESKSNEGDLQDDLVTTYFVSLTSA